MSEQPQGLKDKDLQQYYEALFAMYPTLGWTKLMEDLGRLREIYSNIAVVDTIEDLHFRKGQISMIDEMLTHTVRTEAAYNLAIHEDSGQEQLSTGGKAQVVERGNE